MNIRRTGQQFLLIEHDCLEVMRLEKRDGIVDAIITDIPYNEVNRDSGGLRSIDKGVADSVALDLEAIITEFIRLCSGSFYIFCGQGQLSTIYNTFRANDITTRVIVWEKTNPSPMNGQNVWLSGIELAVFGKKPGATYNGHCKNTVIRYPTGLGETEHPTEKPVRIMNEFVLTSTNPGDVVFDPFMGSGTTGVSCAQLDRRFIGCENDPGFFEMASKRIEAARKQPTLRFPAAQKEEIPEQLRISI